MKLGASQSPVQSDDAVNIHPSRARAARLVQQSFLMVWRWRRGGRGGGGGGGAVPERVDTKNAFNKLVCTAEESGDNGLVVLDEDVKEQILDAIKDGLGANDHAATISSSSLDGV